MSMYKPLNITRQVQKEIVEAIHRMFMLHTENVNIHFDEQLIQIHIFPEPGADFNLPGGPLDIRLHEGGKQEFLPRA